MRDGERFFAEGRDNANYELLQQQMKAAGDWRLGLRQQVLVSLAELGRDVQIVQQTLNLGKMIDNESSPAYSGGGYVSGGELGWYGNESGLSDFVTVSATGATTPYYAGVPYSGMGRGGGGFGGGGGGFDGDDFSKSGSSGVDLFLEFPAQAKEPQFTGVIDGPLEAASAGSSVERYLTPWNEENGRESLDQSNRDMSGFDMGDYIGDYSVVGDKQLFPFNGPFAGPMMMPSRQPYGGRYRGRMRRYGNQPPSSGNWLLGLALTPPLPASFADRKKEAISPWVREQQYGQWLAGVVPELPLPPAVAKPPATEWPAEAVEISRSLLRADALRALTGGLEVRRTVEGLDPIWNRITGRAEQLELYSPSAWLTRPLGEGTHTVVQWCTAVERGVFSRAFELGRVRKRRGRRPRADPAGAGRRFAAGDPRNVSRL